LQIEISDKNLDQKRDQPRKAIRIATGPQPRVGLVRQQVSRSGTMLEMFPLRITAFL
jgi:hypothetical protein